MSNFVSPRAQISDDGLLKRTKTAAFGTAGTNLSVKQGRLYKATVINTGATAYFVQIFNKATPPANTDVPIWEERLPASGSVPLQFDFGLYAAAGLGIAISTTAGVLTLAAANDAIAYAQYSTLT